MRCASSAGTYPLPLPLRPSPRWPSRFGRENGSLFPRFLCTDPRIIPRGSRRRRVEGVKRAERKEQRGRRGWRRRRRKGTAILRGKEQDTDSLSTQYRESFSHASGLSSTMAVGGDGGGWWKREGVDLSCQTLAPRGGAPSLPRPPVRTPRCPIEIAGFGGVSLCSPPSLLPFSPFRSLSQTHSLALSLSLFLFQRASTLHPTFLSPSTLSTAENCRRGYASPLHVFALPPPGEGSRN